MTRAPEQHARLVGYLVARLLEQPVVVVGRDAEDTATALQQTLRIAAARDVPLELVAPDRFVTLERLEIHGVSQYLAQTAILTPAAQARADDPLAGPLLASPQGDPWVYKGLGRFTRRSGHSGALAGTAGDAEAEHRGPDWRIGVIQGVDGPTLVKLEQDDEC